MCWEFELYGLFTLSFFSDLNLKLKVLNRNIIFNHDERKMFLIDMNCD